MRTLLFISLLSVVGWGQMGKHSQQLAESQTKAWGDTLPYVFTNSGSYACPVNYHPDTFVRACLPLGTTCTGRMDEVRCFKNKIPDWKASAEAILQPLIWEEAAIKADYKFESENCIFVTAFNFEEVGHPYPACKLKQTYTCPNKSDFLIQNSGGDWRCVHVPRKESKEN